MKRRDNVFTSVALPPVDSNSFDLSHEIKWTGNMGYLYPMRPVEIVPGDVVNMDFVNMARFAPLVSPLMHKVRFQTDNFFVPLRILWDGFETWITGKNSSQAPVIYIDGIVEIGSLAQYLGIPAGDYSANPVKVSAFQVAAYCLIYDEWYRDQNLSPTQFSPLIPGDNNPDYASFFTKPFKRAWEHDYFTACLPTPQSGASVEIPLTVANDQVVQLTPNLGGANNVRKATNHALASDSNLQTLGGALDSSTADGNLVIDPNGQWVVDVNAGAADLNDLRQAWALQSYLERLLRGGARFTEWLRSMFGVTSSDSRLQRPELIRRSTQQMSISEVLATAQSSNDGSTAEVPVGDMAGHGISVGGGENISYHAEEHGFFITIISVIPDTAYQDGIHKSFLRTDYLDYMLPEFANLGEQPVLLQELKAHDLTTGQLDDVFGYIPRYADYRYMPSWVSGQFAGDLSFWTLGRRFASDPVLNDLFIQCSPSYDIFAVIDEDVDHILAQHFVKMTIRRKLPRYGIPATLS